MGITQAKDVGCSNCRGIYIKGVVDNCKSCNALFHALIYKPLKKEFGKKYKMKFIRNHVVIYHDNNYNARLATKIVLDHLHFKSFERGAYVKCGNYVIKLLKSAGSSLTPNNDIEDQLHWVGVSFKIIPWAETA